MALKGHDRNNALGIVMMLQGRALCEKRKSTSEKKQDLYDLAFL